MNASKPEVGYVEGYYNSHLIYNSQLYIMILNSKSGNLASPSNAQYTNTIMFL